jgi:hypothetical protein
VRILQLTAAGAYANTRGLDHQQIAVQLACVDADDLRYQLSFRRTRQAIEFQQDDATNLQPLANDELAKIAILRDQDAVITICHIEDVFIRRSRPRLPDRCYVKTGSAKPLDDEARDVLIRQKTYHSAVSTVSCCK